MSSTHGNTIENDNYETPVECVDALLKLVDFRPNDEFLEPCKGENENIYSRVNLPEAQKQWAEITQGVDYLNTSFTKKDVIITNPPFSLSEPFIEKMLSELKEDGTLIFLQRVNFLGSVKRVPFWSKVGFPEKAPILVPRPRFVGGGSDSCEYCWFIYDRGNRTSKIPNSFSHIVAEQKPRKPKKPRKSKKKIQIDLNNLAVPSIVDACTEAKTEGKSYDDMTLEELMSNF